MRLYRPVGLRELELIAEAEFRAFPPRLPHQPIFYPVLNVGYATQIARDWNTKDEASGYCGFVTQFEIADDYLACFEVHTVGASSHQELWVPAEELDDFNQQIKGTISVATAHVGNAFTGMIDPDSGLPSRAAAAWRRTRDA